MLDHFLIFVINNHLIHSSYSFEINLENNSAMTESIINNLMENVTEYIYKTNELFNTAPKTQHKKLTIT